MAYIKLIIYINKILIYLFVIIYFSEKNKKIL